MKEQDVRVFEKAFSELSDEGFFRDFTAKVEHVQDGTTAGIQRTAQYENGYGDYTEEKYQPPDLSVGENDILLKTGAVDKDTE